MERYTNLATQASVIAGFSFESLVELEVPEGTHWALAGMYFIFGSMAMALALYCLVVASFACVFGHRLALQGPHGSLEIAVSILIAHRQHIFSVGGLSLVCLVMAAVLMSWIKMGAAAGVVTLIFLIFAAATFHRMVHMARVFEIKDIDLVTGAVRIADPSSRGAGVDLARLNPGSRKVAPAMAPPPQPKQDRYQPLMDEEEVPKKKRSSGLGWFSPKQSSDDGSSSTAYSPGMPGRQPPGSGGGDGGGGRFGGVGRARAALAHALPGGAAARLCGYGVQWRAAEAGDARVRRRRLLLDGVRAAKRRHRPPALPRARRRRRVGGRVVPQGWAAVR